MVASDGPDTGGGEQGPSDAADAVAASSSSGAAGGHGAAASTVAAAAAADPAGGGGSPIARARVVTAPAPLPLDWTQIGQGGGGGGGGEGPYSVVRYPWDALPDGETDLSVDETDLTLVGTHGQKITRMGSDLSTRVPNLERLVLRSQLLRKMEGLGGFAGKLTLLELYDNQIEKLEGLDGKGGEDDDGESNGNASERAGGVGATLLTLDMSYNVIRSMSPVRHCPHLTELYLAQNKLKDIKGLGGLKQLRKIDLGANRIRVMPEELGELESLEELWLGKNKIEEIGGLEKLTKLRRLDVQANRLTSITNLTGQIATLEELYLAHNGIDDFGASDAESGLGLRFTKLNTIDLGRNRLASTKPFAHLDALEELWLSGNRIATFADVEHIARLGTAASGDGGGVKGLEGIYLEMNPVADDFEYRKKLAEMLPSLNQIDADMIGGVASHGMGGGGGMETLAVRMRRMQELAIDRAREQSEREEREKEETLVEEERSDGAGSS